jgi:hypothetical protein
MINNVSWIIVTIFIFKTLFHYGKVYYFLNLGGYHFG